MIVYRNSGSIWQTILLIIILVGLLVAGFYLFIALFPLIVALVLYIWYRVRKKMKEFEKARAQYQENPYENNFQQFRSVHYTYTDNENNQSSSSDTSNPEQGTTKEHDPVIYDITPENYSVEEKK